MKNIDRMKDLKKNNPKFYRISPKIYNIFIINKIISKKIENLYYIHMEKAKYGLIKDFIYLKHIPYLFKKNEKNNYNERYLPYLILNNNELEDIEKILILNIKENKNINTLKSTDREMNI
jgi:hypothetical protein